RSRRHVGAEAGGGRDGDLVPVRTGRTAHPRIDQVMLLDAAAQPASPRLAARGETSRFQSYGAAARKAHDDLAARREVATGRDEAALGQKAKSLVDDETLHDAVEVEQGASRTREQ